MQNSATTAQKCAEMFRDNGQYWFVCYHCGSTFEHCDQTTKHVDSHFNGETNDAATTAAIDDNTEIEVEPAEIFLVNGTDWPMDVKDLVSTHDKMVCNRIETKVNYVRQMVDALNDTTDVDKPYKCEQCAYSFRHKGSLRKHIQQKHEPNADTKFTCDICDRTFTANRSLKNHIAVAHGRADLLAQSFECERCGKLFAHQSRLECHLKCHLTKSIENKRVPTKTEGPTLKCELCGDTLKNRATLRNHMKRVHGRLDLELPKPFKCAQCNKCFVHKNRLDAHLVEHENPKPRKCDICAQQFASRGKLQYHMEMHKEQSFACPQCQFTSRTKNNLDQHVRNVHTKDLTRFACDQCSKLFKYKVSYDYHMRQHSGERPYQCYICGMAYYTSSKLTAHMKNSHSTETFRCDLCSKSLKSSYWLKKHLKTHSDERLYNCTICNSNFKSANTLRQHKMIHDTVKRFKCNYCDMRFAQSAGRRGHERLRHLLI